MIFIKQYNSLFDSPRVEEPKIENFVFADAYDQSDFDGASYYDAMEAHKIWLSSKIEVIGNPKWEDGAEKIEGVDYGLLYSYIAETEEEIQDALYEQFNELPQKSKPVAIPITPKPDDLVPGVREEDSLASDKATSKDCCDAPVDVHNNTRH